MTILYGSVNHHDSGLVTSARAMATQMAQYQTHADNVVHFGVPGYQKKMPLVRTFSEYLGPAGVETMTDTEVGRVRKSGNPLDMALNTPGYFQRLNPSTQQVELSRDGRVKIDPQGNLLSLDNKPVLDSAGLPIKLPYIPLEPEKDFEVDEDGSILLYNHTTGEISPVGKLGIVTLEGTPAQQVNVAQGYVEDSNVFLQQEYMAFMPLRRQFEANRNVFILQSDLLSKMIQELGRAQ